jgi:predicted nicotinamide N-methyase
VTSTIDLSKNFAADSRMSFLLSRLSWSPQACLAFGPHRVHPKYSRITFLDLLKKESTMRDDRAFAAFTFLRVQLLLWVGTASPFGVG